jgi:methyl-accepting chemotaxis protein
MLLIMLTTGLALVLASVCFVVADAITARRAIIRGLELDADSVGSTCTAALRFDDKQTAEEALAIMRNEPHVLTAALYTEKGDVFATYRRSDGAGAPPDEPGEDGWRRVGGRVELFRPVILGGERVGTVYIERDLADIGRRLRYDALVVGAVFVLALCVAVTATTRFQRILTVPLKELLRTTDAVARSRDYSLRAHKLSEDELGSLTDEFNAMLQEIQHRDREVSRARDELEQRVQDRTLQLRQRSDELERFNRAAVGREQRMIELKREVNALRARLGLEPEYDLSFLEGGVS